MFAIFVIGGSFGGGNMFQVNQAFQLVENITGGENSFLTRLWMVIWFSNGNSCWYCNYWGNKTIAKVTEKIVPFMVVIYVAASLFVLIC